MDKYEAIAVEEGIKRVVNNKKLYYRLLTSFSGRKLVGDIVDAANSGNFEDASRACHALRGTAANLAMNPLAAVVAQVEESIKDEVSFDMELISKLQQHLEAVEAAIKEIVSE